MVFARLTQEMAPNRERKKKGIMQTVHILGEGFIVNVNVVDDVVIEPAL